jgi:hypothetical protein
MPADAELVRSLHRRARRAMLASLAVLNVERPRLPRGKAGADAVHEALSLAVLRFLVLSLGRARGLFSDPRTYERGRLFTARDARFDVGVTLQNGVICWAFPDLLTSAGAPFVAELELGSASDGIEFGECTAEIVGNLYEQLLAEAVSRGEAGGLELLFGKKRKQTGTFFTPRALTATVVARALEPLERRIRASAHRAHDFVIDYRVCDPAVGGGAFLIEVARALAARAGAHEASARRRAIVTCALYGVDLNPIALAVAEAALCLFVADPTLPMEEAGRNLRVGDALVGAPDGAVRSTASERSGASERHMDFVAQFPDVFERGGFDLIIGNPPWVAYAGRAAQPLAAARKAYFAAHYTTLKGYPTLHGLFVERALRLAPQGTVALVVPSPVADLQGYRAVRRAVRATHTPCEPMLEFGQDAFESVTQPCFALIAEARTGSASSPSAEDGPFRLAERQRAGGQAAEVKAPSALSEIAKLPVFPRDLFGEMGFQTTGVVSKQLLLRAPAPDGRHHYPLLEGRDVKEFSEGPPRLFLAPDTELLRKARCRLRDRDDYRRVRFVIRQTARFPIAALHDGLPFRNSLLAGFAVDGFPAELVVGLLNSSLYRALHLATQRDGRQAVFPQVKVAHLRALPAPPADPEARADVAALSAALTENADRALLVHLDAAVFRLFGVSAPATREVLEFLTARGAPRAEPREAGREM